MKQKVKWDNKVGISLETHTEYVQKFGECFYNQVKRLIDSNQKIDDEKESLNEDDSELIREVLDHARFCNQKISQFHGRKPLLNSVLLNL